MKKNALAVAGTVLILFGLMIGSTGAMVTMVKVVPETQVVAAGNSFPVNIIVEDIVDMKANQAVLNFNPGALNATEIIEGDFLKSGGNTLAVEQINNTEGTAVFSYALWGTWTSVSDSRARVIATIEFSTYEDAEGTFALDLTEVTLINENNEEISTGVSNGTVTISAHTPTSTPTQIPIPGLSGIDVIVVIGILAILFAITRKRRRWRG